MPTSIGNKTNFILPHILQQLGWWVIVLLLIFLPFQLPLQQWLGLPHQFLWIDECLISFSFILFLLSFSYLGKIKRRAVHVLSSLLFIVIIGFLSALYNTTPVMIGGGAIFNYIKLFLPMPIFCMFSMPKNKILFCYNLLLNLTLFLCIFAFIQEIAFFAGFPLEKLGVNVEFIHSYKRFGFLRTSSLMGHPNVFGLYALFFLILNFSIKRRFNWQNMLLLSGIILSGARIVWAASLFAVLHLLIQKNKRIIIGVCFLVIMIAIVILLPALKTPEEITSEKYFRRYTILKSVEIWKDHPILGVGPGMFGGWVTPWFISSVFDKYQFLPQWVKAIQRHRTLDSFWFQSLAEIGLLGTLAFLVLLVVLWRVGIKEATLAQDSYGKRLLAGFSLMPLVIFFYLFTNVLNVTPFLLTYSMLLGLTLAMKDDNSLNQ